MPYSRVQLLEALRTDHPEFKAVDDNKLFAALAIDHPDIVKGISELQSAAPQPQSDNRTAAEVAEDQAALVLTGIPKAITGLPGMLGESAKAAYQMISGRGSAKAQDLVKGAVAPITTSVRGAAALVAPGSVTAPTREEFEQAAEGAGANLGGILIGEGVAKVAPVVTKAAVKALNDANVPEKLMVRAAANRTPLPAANMRSLSGDMAVTAAGYGVKGAAGAGVAEALNLIRKSSRFRNMTASLQESLARQIAGNPGSFAALGLTHEPAGEIVSRSNPKAVAVDEASRIAQAPILPREVQSEPLNIPRPGTPEFIQQQIEDARIQAEHENFPSGEIKPPPSPSSEIPMPNGPPSPGPRPITVRDLATAEQAIRPIGLGQRSTMFNVPRLLNEVPELVGIRKGPNFDAKLTDAFTEREANVIKAEAAVPREVTVPNPKELLDAIKQEYDGDPHMQQTANKLGRLIEQWEALPDQVPWEQFRDAKRSFFEENSTRSAPMRQAYRALIESVKGISPELDAANQAYSIVRRAMDDANMETSSKVVEGQSVRGRRIKDVGKVAKPTIAEQIKQSFPSKAAPTVEPPKPSPKATQPALLGENTTEAMSKAAAGRRPELLKEGKQFDQSRLVESPLFQGRGGPQQFLGTDVRAEVPAAPTKVTVGKNLPSNFPTPDVSAAAIPEMQNFAQSIRDIQQHAKALKGGSAMTMKSNVAGKLIEEELTAEWSKVGKEYGINTPKGLEEMTPGQIADAIESGKGKAYNRVKAAFERELMQSRQSSVQSQRGTAYGPSAARQAASRTIRQSQILAGR